MENRNIIIILVAIIIVLAVVAGTMFLQSENTKNPSKVKITSDKEQYEGGKLKIQLTDLNKTPISKEIVNITITNKKGKVVVDDVVKTDSKGKAKLDLDLKKGKYENYTATNTTQKLTIKEKVVKTKQIESSDNSNNGDTLEGPEVDSLGITKQQAMRLEQVSGEDVKYDPESKMYVQYDPKYGVYHN